MTEEGLVSSLANIQSSKKGYLKRKKHFKNKTRSKKIKERKECSKEKKQHLNAEPSDPTNACTGTDHNSGIKNLHSHSWLHLNNGRQFLMTNTS